MIDALDVDRIIILHLSIGVVIDIFRLGSDYLPKVFYNTTLGDYLLKDFHLIFLKKKFLGCLLAFVVQ